MVWECLGNVWDCVGMFVISHDFLVFPSISLNLRRT